MDVRVQALRQKLSSILPLMDERQRRLVAAAEARWYGRGGVQSVARVTGMSRQTIYRGLADLDAGVQSQRTRVAGGGRKRLSEHQPKLVARLESLIEPSVRGDPQSPLRWTCRSARSLEAALQQAGHSISYHTVANLLHELDIPCRVTARARRARWIIRSGTRNFDISVSKLWPACAVARR